MDARKLTILQAIAEQGSISAAASALYLTQPALSRQLSKLEADAGVSLVERTPRGSRLTAAGRVLADAADRIAGEIAAAETSIATLSQHTRTVVRVGAFPSAAASLVVRALAILRSQDDSVEVAFRDCDPRTALALLRDDAIDLAIVYREPGNRPPQGPFEVALLLTHPMLAALPADHDLASRRSIALHELAREHWLVGGRGQGFIRRACLAAGFDPHIAAETDHQRVTHDLIASGVGVSLVPALSVPVRPDLAFVPLDPSVERELFAVYRALTGSIEKVLRAIRESARELRLPHVSSVMTPEPQPSP